MLDETIYGSVPVSVGKSGKTKRFRRVVNDMFEDFYDDYSQILHPGYIFPYKYLGYVRTLNDGNEQYQLQTLNVHLNNVKIKSVTTEGFYKYDKEELRNQFHKLIMNDIQLQGIRKILPFINK